MAFGEAEITKKEGSSGEKWDFKQKVFRWRDSKQNVLDGNLWKVLHLWYKLNIFSYKIKNMGSLGDKFVNFYQKLKTHLIFGQQSKNVGGLWMRSELKMGVLRTLQSIPSNMGVPPGSNYITILRGYCTPGQFLDCFCIFLKNYNTLVTSKICFL